MTWLGVLLALLLAAAGPLQARTATCEAPSELTAASDTFPNAARALKAGRPLLILVMGSGSSTVGGTSGPANLYPARLQVELRARLPSADITVTVRGGRGLLASDMLAQLDEAVATLKPTILVWQTGAVDAVRGIDPDTFMAVLAAGVAKTEAAKIDLVLMDMQFSRAGRAAINLGPYRDAMKTIAATSAHTSFFPRYELMRYWAEAGRIDVERAPRTEWAAVADRLHACLAEVLAETIAEGIALSR